MISYDPMTSTIWASNYDGTVYYKNIDPVLKSMKDNRRLIRINGEQSIKGVHNEIMKHIT